MSDNTQLAQNHYGDGDNVAGHKNVHNVYSLSASNLEIHVGKILLDIYYDNIENACKTLENLDDISSKDQETKSLLDCLKMRISIANNEVSEDSRARITKILNSDINSSLAKDIAISTFIRLLVLLEKKDEAISSYQQLNGSDYKYSRHIYTLCLASKEELATIYAAGFSLMDEINLIVLLGALSNSEMHAEAVVVCEKLLEISPKYENQLFHIIALTAKINHEIQATPFMYLDRDKHEEILDLVEDFIAKTKDNFVFNKREAVIFQNLLALTNFTTWAMFPDHLKDIKQIKSVAPNNGVFFDQIEKSHITPTLLEKLEEKLRKDEVLLDDEIGALVYFISEKMITRSVARDWLNRNPVFGYSEEILSRFLFLLFQSLINLDENSSYKQITELEDNIKAFVTDYQTSIKEINPIALNALCDSLVSHTPPMYLSIYQLLEKALPEKKPLNSLYHHYLHSLLYLDQLESLDNELRDIESYGYDENINILLLKKQLFLLKNNIDNALKCMDMALQISPNSPNLWLQKLEIVYKNFGECVAANVVKNIPEEVFDKPRHNLYVLLQFIANNISIVFSETKLFKMFLQDPSDTIIQAIINIHFGAIINKNANTSNICNEIEGFHGGVVYRISGKTYEKVVVSNTSSRNPFFLKKDSPLAITLESMQVTETKYFNLNEVTLTERKPSRLSIFHFALSCMEDIQQTSHQPPSIQSFSISTENPAEDMIKVLSRMQRVQNDYNQILQSTAIPLYMKGYKLDSKNEAAAAAQLLYCRGANTSLLHGYGNANQSNILLLDVYSFMYICILGLSHKLIETGFELCYAIETQTSITNWLDEITDQDYMTIKADQGQLIVNTKETMEAAHKDLIESMRYLLANTKIIEPEIGDVPIESNKLKVFFGSSIYATFKICHSKKIPWLCLDQALSCLVIFDNTCQIVNPYQFFSELSKTASSKEKINTMALSAYYGIHTFFTFSDMIQLSRSINQEDFYLLCSLLSHYNLSFVNIEHFMYFLSYLIINASETDLMPEIKLARLRTIFSACCKISLKIIDMEKPIERISAFVLYLMQSGRITEDGKKTIIFNLLRSYAIENFMDIREIIEKALELKPNYSSIQIRPNKPAI